MPRAIAVLAIGGIDPTGHAGLAADVRAGAALNTLVSPVAAAITVQGRGGVRRVEGVAPDLLREQIAAVLEDLAPAAVKIGLLPGEAQVSAVAEALAGYRGPVVLDPVFSATPGGALAAAEAVGALAGALGPRVTLVTPNLLEAGVLLKTVPPRDAEAMKAAARALRGLGFGAVLMKGGHLPGARVPDYLADEGEGLWIEGERLETPNTRGTGCMLATLIAALLGQGQPLRLACVGGKNALVILLRKNASHRWPQGAGPIL